MNFGTLLAQTPGNDGNEAGFTRVSWQCSHMEMLTPKCDFDPLPVWFFEEHESQLQNAYKPNAFPMDCNAFWCKGLKMTNKQ